MGKLSQNILVGPRLNTKGVQGQSHHHINGKTQGTQSGYQLC